MILSKMCIYYLSALYKYLVTCAMRKKRDEKKFNLRKKKFFQIEIQNRQSLTDDVNIIVAKSKISILHTRHVPLSYTIANRANRFSMLRFEPAWPTWMATSSTFINLFFLINGLIGTESHFRIPCFVSRLRETWEKGKQFFVYFTRWQLHKSYLLLAVNW